MDPIRRATPADAPDIARIHVAAWRETYPGLLPAHVIEAASDAARRRPHWEAALRAGSLRVALAPSLGFAAMGPQRDAGLAARGYPEELHAIYVLRAGQGRGLGRALLRAVWGGRAATALVVAGNADACAFYEAAGAPLLKERPEEIGGHPILERVHAWPGGALPCKEGLGEGKDGPG